MKDEYLMDNFSQYHFSDNAKIITKRVPGKKSLQLLRKQKLLESNNVSYPKGIPLAFDKAKGAIITDVDGNQFIDFFSGCGVLNLGHNNQDIVADINNFNNKILQAVDFPTIIRMEFIETLLKLLPTQMKGKFRINFGGPTGSDAVETALKLARLNNNRHTIISFQGSYHGMTMGALSVTSRLSHRKKINPLIPGIHFFPYGACYRCPFELNNKECSLLCVTYFKNVLDNPHSGIDIPSAIIVEPIQGEGGTYIPPKGWLKLITTIAQERGIIVIFDEIQSGFFRTGKLFASEDFGIVPDIIALSKGIGGIGLPLSLILYKNNLDLWEPGTHIGTFRGNQMAMAAGLSAMRFIQKYNIKAHVERLEKVFLGLLNKLYEESKFIGEIRGKGMMFGIEYVKDKSSKEPFPEFAKLIRRLCYENGLLVELGGYFDNVVRFLPPLIITGQIANNGLIIFKKVNRLAEERLESIN